MATAWEEADVDSLARLAQLRDDFHRGEVRVSALRYMQQLEDRFGLNPKARRGLQWEIRRMEPPTPLNTNHSRHMRAV